MAEKSKTKAKLLARKVQFEFPAPHSREVYVVGNFNNWDTRANPMKKDKNGMWKTTLSLKPDKMDHLGNLLSRLGGELSLWNLLTSCIRSTVQLFQEQV